MSKRILGKRARGVLVVLGVCTLAGGTFAIAQPQAAGDLLPFLSPLLDTDTDEAAGVAIGPLPGDPPVDANDFKALKGYSGPLFNPSVQTSSVEVLDSTVRVRRGTSWGAAGLVRNQTTDTVAQVTVTAQLRSANGDLIDTVSAKSPVRGVRSGEPVPFELTSGVPASTVADVDYSAVSAPGSASSREFDVVTYWQLPYGNRTRRDDTYPQADPPDPPYPYVRYGKVENLSGALTSPTVVGAWLDTQGRVLEVAVLPRITIGPGETDGAIPDTQPIAPDSFGDFAYTNDDPLVAAELADAEFIRWAGGEGP